MDLEDVKPGVKGCYAQSKNIRCNENKQLKGCYFIVQSNDKPQSNDKALKKTNKNWLFRRFSVLKI